MNDETKIYPQKSITFLLTPQSIVVVTSLGQSFYLAPKNHFYKRRMFAIRKVIEVGEIRDLLELSEWCGGGTAVEWLNTSRKYELDNFKVLA